MTRFSPSGAAGSEGRRGPRYQLLPRDARLRSGRDIRRVLRLGNRYTGPLVDVFMAPSPNRRPRFAVIVPRFGNTAVARNRIRRRLKELARKEWLPRAHRAGSEVDLILKAKPAAYGASYERLHASLETRLSDICGPSSSA